jgi:hypothetical protein
MKTGFFDLGITPSPFLQIGRLFIRLMFEPRDLWVGVYVKEPYWEMGTKQRVFYVIVIPMFPVLIEWSGLES